MEPKKKTPLWYSVYALSVMALPAIIVLVVFFDLLRRQSSCLFSTPTVFIVIGAFLLLVLKFFTVRHLGSLMKDEFDQNQQVVKEVFPENATHFGNVSNQKIKAYTVDIFLGILCIMMSIWLYDSWVTCVNSLTGL